MKNIILVVVSIVISLAILEAGLRLFYAPDESTSHNHRIPHPTLGWTLEPIPNIAMYYEKRRYRLSIIPRVGEI